MPCTSGAHAWPSTTVVEGVLRPSSTNAPSFFAQDLAVGVEQIFLRLLRGDRDRTGTGPGPGDGYGVP